MTIEIEIGGRRRHVAARRAGIGWRVTVDGREVYAELAQAGDRWSLLVAEEPAEAGHAGSGPAFRSYEIALERGAAGERIVYVNGQRVPVAMADDPRLMFGRRDGGHAGRGAASGRILAPMPGRIVKVLVARGETVTAGQGLLVVEAMKMENEVRAPVAGVLTDVRVAEGMAVEANTVLAVVEAS